MFLSFCLRKINVVIPFSSSYSFVLFALWLIKFYKRKERYIAGSTSNLACIYNIFNFNNLLKEKVVRLMRETKEKKEI